MNYESIEGGVLWGTKMNKSGIMGFVDKWWIFWSRVGAIFGFIGFILAVISIIIAVVGVSGDKESYSYGAVSRLRHVMRTTV